jgi:hypothetical protein
MFYVDLRIYTRNEYIFILGFSRIILEIYIYYFYCEFGRLSLIKNLLYYYLFLLLFSRIILENIIFDFMEILGESLELS